MSSDAGLPAICARNVGKCYHIYQDPKDRLRQVFLRLWGRQAFREFWALRNVSFEVYPGETVGVIGRNGSGKSTLLHVIGGVLSPSTGEVEVRGRIAALLELGGGFNPEFTGRENVFLNAAILGIPREEIKRHFDKIASFADIGEFIDQPVKIYSSGMFVRLAFSVISNLNADILIIDETLAVGDEKFQKKCFNLLEEIRSRGSSILFVSHSMPTVEQICDRAILLEGGQVLAQGSPKEVIDTYHLNLYGNENLHLKYLNRMTHSPGDDKSVPGLADEGSGNGGAIGLTGDVQTLLGEAGKIVWVRIFDSNEVERYVFRSQEDSEIAFQTEFFKPFDQVIAGITIRTLQGVKVYGTSTFYWEPVPKVAAGEKPIFRFRQKLRLGAGVYYLSVAVAEKVGHQDMNYIDKLADTVVFKILEVPVRGEGLANLASEILVQGS
jgi:lipopolysaccharide transport system ATP-binding protein